MPLSSTNTQPGNIVKSADIIQFFNLFTGAMTDQAVSLKNQVTVGGNQGASTPAFTINGVAAQTADYLDITASGGAVGGIFKIPSSGVLTLGSGLTITSGGETIQAGGLTVTAGGVTVSAGGLTIGPSASTTDGTLGAAAGGLLTMGNGSAAIPLGAYKIAETVLGAPAATFNFTSIPATFRHLYLEVDGRFDQVVVSNSLLGTFNGDSGANYNRHYQSFTGTGAAAQTEGLAQTSYYLGEFSGASAIAGRAGHTVVMIANYAGTTFHKDLRFLSDCISPNGAGTSQHAVGGGQWANTAAINRITLTAPGAGNWIAGSVATLYGLP